MKPEFILYGISIIFLSIGVYALYYSIKKWNPDYVPRKATARLIRNILGSKGSKIFSGIIGVGLMIFGIGLGYLTLTKDSRKANKNYTDSEWVEYTNHSQGITARIKEKDLRKSMTRASDFQKGNYKTISFNGMGLKKVPEYVWDMTGLSVLDLSNNNIKTLDEPENQWIKFEELNLIVLDNNPMDSLEVQRLYKKIGDGGIQFKPLYDTNY